MVQLVMCASMFGASHRVSYARCLRGKITEGHTLLMLLLFFKWVIASLLNRDVIEYGSRPSHISIHLYLVHAIS